MDLAILGLTVSSVSAMGAILAAVSFWLNRGKVEERADQALARAKEGTIAMTGSCLRLQIIALRSRPTLRSSRRWQRQIPLP